MRNLLAFALLSVVSSVSYSALAEGPEASNEGPGHGEDKGEHADRKGEHEEKEPRFFAGADMVLGFGNLPAEGGEAPSTLPASFLFGGKYFLTPQFAVGARWPFVAGSIKEGEASKGEIAVGNVEIAAEYQVPLAKGIKLPIELGFALPTASGDEFDEKGERRKRSARLNAAAAASRGGENNALFAAHRLGIVPLLGLEYERGAIEAAIWTKMELLIRAGGALPPAPLEQKKLAVESVSGAGVFFWFMDEKLAIGTRAWVSVALAEEVENPTAIEKPSKVQLVLEPGVRAKLGAFRPSLSYIAPIAGALGDRKVGGVRLVLGAAL